MFLYVYTCNKSLRMLGELVVYGLSTLGLISGKPSWANLRGFHLNGKKYFHV